MKRIIIALFALLPVAALAFTAAPPGVPVPAATKKAADAAAKSANVNALAICKTLPTAAARSTCTKSASASYTATKKANAAQYKVDVAAYKPLQVAAQAAWKAQDAACKALSSAARSACIKANNEFYGG